MGAGRMSVERHGGVTCRFCQAPIPPVDYWAAVVLPTTDGAFAVAAITCLWVAQAAVE